MQPKLDDAAAVARIRAAAPDLVVSWFWTKKVPRSVRDIAPLGAFGVHPSLLPRHRGPDPYFWAILRGDRTTGVTAHRLDDEYDTGAILGTRELAVDTAWDAWTLARRLDRPSLELLRTTTRVFAAGVGPVEIAQDSTSATEAPEPTDDDLAIRWSASADDVVRLVRAAAPWPGAFTQIGDATTTITRAEVAPSVPRALERGEACVIDGVVTVRAADAGVRLLEGRSEDDELLSAAGLAALLSQSTRLP